MWGFSGVFITFAPEISEISNMKRCFYAVLMLIALVTFVGCKHVETYGDKKEAERKAISEFIAERGITVITEEKFQEQGDVTNLENNEYVYLTNKGIYMQIIHPGGGEELPEGNSYLVCRFMEYDIMAEDTMAINNTNEYAAIWDRMKVTRSSSTFTGTFESGVMYNTYGAAVPPGWLVPLSYIKPSRNIEESHAKVRIIVPHTQGHNIATTYVSPYFYEITYQLSY